MSGLLEPSSKVVIIGAGHAGGSVAAFLRQFGFEDAITLIGDESAAPYQRPPLSKAWLSGETDIETLSLRPNEWYADNNVTLKLGVSANAIDRDNKTVAVSDGSNVDYDVLVIATGACPRWTGAEGENLKNVYSLRTVEDAEALKNAISPGGQAALIGAGYIGLEVAASLRKAGIKATVIERESRSLARVASEPIASFLEDYHRAQGVKFLFDKEVEKFAGDGSVNALELKDGSKIDCDIAVVGIGVVPNDAIARDAGLECGNGIIVDIDARSSDPSIFAIGDVSYRPVPHYDCTFRLESVPNALEQSRRVAAVLCGRPAPAPEIPWFWSDQFDLKIQIAGLTLDCDEIVTRGDPASKKFAVFHLRKGVIRAVEAVNAAPEFMMGKKLIGQEASVDASKLGDISVSMKEIAS
ncbi:NAD(P)/FAD-dependent oxidoreductase [Hyphococcus sp. DH-69]|uniref:NAD(P)/FAD-dependent oxidoreductase n=1 Tax=Hyphococcus formosus TaxID=3143534 RepID=UPI00398A8E60